MKKRVLFLTGTRADFGKLKPLMRAVKESPDLECDIFVTGMHTLARYGYTVDEVRKAGFENIHLYMNQHHGEPMELILANTIAGLSRYLHESRPDMIVVHGDRIETLAGAIAGSLNNILTAHIEGGERSGTIDELIRHSVSKMSHLHFVANEEAAIRLRQLGEHHGNIYIIGSPDIDIMLSPDLPSISQVKEHYEIPFDNYSVVAFHPVTTEEREMPFFAEELVHALVSSGKNYVVIYPNNDKGADGILDAYRRLESNNRFRLFPSLKFEYFLSLLKHADLLIGNSSAGVREAPVYGVPTINIGTRQNGRFSHDSIANVFPERQAILTEILKLQDLPRSEPCLHFGRGDSAVRFLNVLSQPRTWETPRQKEFIDIVPQQALTGNSR